MKLPIFCAALLAQHVPEADRVAQALELHMSGSLNAFDRRTNVGIINQLPLSLCDHVTERSCSLGYTTAIKKNEGGIQHTGIVLSVDGMARA